MNIHEYQAKAVLREFAVPTPRGIPAFSVEEAVKGAHQLGGPVWVVKAQIHAGGRGKAGGVKVVKSIDDVKKEAERLLGSTLVTHQTGARGKQVNRLYVEEGSAIDRESICRRWSIARHHACPSWCRPKAAWISRKSPTRRRRRSSPSR